MQTFGAVHMLSSFSPTIRIFSNAIALIQLTSLHCLCMVKTNFKQWQYPNHTTPRKQSVIVWVIDNLPQPLFLIATNVTPNYNAVRASSGDSCTEYQQDLLGHIKYRSQKPINAYKTWLITNIDAVIQTITKDIRAGDDLKDFQQNIYDKVDKKYLYLQLHCPECWLELKPSLSPTCNRLIASVIASGGFRLLVYNSAVMILNNDPLLQSIWIGPAKTFKMVKNKWTSLKVIHYTINKYCNQTGTYWDNINGAGIHGPAAITVWESYVAQKAPANLSSPSSTAGPSSTTGLSSTAAPSFITSPSSTAVPSSSASLSFIISPSSTIAGPSFTTGPCSITGGLTTTTSSTSAKHPYEGTVDSFETSSTGLHHLGVSPPSKKACLQAGTHVSKKMSNAVKMSGATQAAKITPAVAVMGMQGTVNRLTDVFEKFIIGSIAGGTAGSMQPVPVPAPESSMDLVACTVNLLQTEDTDMPSEQRAVLIMVLGEKENECLLKFYVFLTDKETRHAFIQKLITDARAP
ncbi:hypothetical protein BDR05DRAFT_950677 [Suillus weaverae]|nr:hypothetical protein BDR05DRAFT_950677 [Suillus weaverae]